MNGHEFSDMDKNKSAYKLKKLPSIYWLNLDSEDQRKIYMECNLNIGKLKIILVSQDLMVESMMYVNIFLNKSS